MDEILSFGTIVLVVAGGFLLALAVIKAHRALPDSEPGALPADRRAHLGPAGLPPPEPEDGRADRGGRARPDPVRRRDARRLEPVQEGGVADRHARHRRHVRDGRGGRRRGALPLRLPVDDGVDPRRRGRAHGSCGHVLRARQPRGRRALRDDPGGRVGRERPGRDRADDRDPRLRDEASTARSGAASPTSRSR